MKILFKHLKWITLITLVYSNVLSAQPGWTQVINDVLDPAAGLTKLIYILCYIAGAGFLAGAVLQYKYHRDNPQQVRLSTPILLLILGLVLVCLPLLTKLSSASVAATTGG